MSGQSDNVLIIVDQTAPAHILRIASVIGVMNAHAKTGISRRKTAQVPGLGFIFDLCKSKDFIKGMYMKHLYACGLGLGDNKTVYCACI